MLGRISLFINLYTFFGYMTHAFMLQVKIVNLLKRIQRLCFPQNDDQALIGINHRKKTRTNKMVILKQTKNSIYNFKSVSILLEKSGI